MYRIILSVILTALVTLGVQAADPMQTSYSPQQCEGSLTPYPRQINPATYPDSLVPVMINHVGRHGSRYPASATRCHELRQALRTADSLGTITATGRRLLRLCDEVIRLSTDRWGALDSLGEAEQRAIATRMYYNFKPLMAGARVQAMSSYSPRCMMSMFVFTQQLDRLDNSMEFTTTTGRQNSPLLRFFDLDKEYVEWRKDGGSWQQPYDDYVAQVCPTAPIERALGRSYPYTDDADKRRLAMLEYYLVAGCSAMSVSVNSSEFFARDEYNALWSCFNLGQYLQRTATTLTAVPAEIASPLLADLLTTTERMVMGEQQAPVVLRFGHAETLMPLLSLLHLDGCYYLTNYWDTVAQHWCDFNVVPMAANLQLILFKHKKNGRYYLRTDLNERPVPLLPGSTQLYTPWPDAQRYITRCIPLYAQ